MTPQNRPKYTGPSPAPKTAGIGPQSRRQELKLGMHDIYRTDKLSTDMGENDVIFIAPINK